MPSDNDLDLSIIASSGRGEDPALDRLAGLADLGAQVNISVLADGRLVHGRLCGRHDWAEHFDTEIGNGLTSARDQADDEALRTQIDLFHDALANATLLSQVKERDERVQELDDRIKAIVGDRDDWTLSDLPDKEAREFIQAHRPRQFYTLKDARVIAAPMLRIDVKYVRLDARNISAWWMQSDVVPDEE